MTSVLTVPWMVILVVVTGGGYALATVGMKLASGMPGGMAAALIAVGLAAAIMAEITLLRNAELPVVYLGIVVFETLLVLGWSAMAGGVLSGAQVAGAAMVLGGFALVTQA